MQPIAAMLLYSRGFLLKSKSEIQSIVGSHAEPADLMTSTLKITDQFVFVLRHYRLGWIQKFPAIQIKANSRNRAQLAQLALRCTECFLNHKLALFIVL